jgi:hypothetical protein
MEETPEPAIDSNRNCASCGQPAMNEDHPTPLCADCRKHFIRFPIPLWIKGFAGGIGVLVLFSLFTFPKDLSVGITLEKGVRAEKEKKYVTAQRAMESVLEKVPSNVEAKGHLLIDAFYNQDLQTFGEQYEKLKYVSIEDHDLLATINYVVDKAAPYFTDSADAFAIFKVTHPDLTRAPDTAWTAYMMKNPHDLRALMAYVSQLFDRKEYDRCDSCTRYVLKQDGEFLPALAIMSSIKRQQHKLDSALFYNDRLLSINRESPDGIASKARTLLMQKKDNEALDLALKSYELEKNDVYTQGTLILAYHFNHRIRDRDDLLKKALITAAKDSTDIERLQYVQDIIDNKEKFRD